MLIAACSKPAPTPPENRTGLFITPASVAVEANEQIQFTFDAEGLPAGLSTVTFNWNFADGTINATGSQDVDVVNNKASHAMTYSFVAEGAYGVFVSVQDEADNEIFTGVAQVTVGDVTGLEREFDLSVCNAWEAADQGSYGITVDYWDISTIPTGAVFDMQFNALSQPDRYLIEYPVGTLVHDTGWRGSSGYENDPQFPGGIAGPGLGMVEGLFTKGAADEFKITIIGGEPGTLWDYDIRCNAD